MWEYDWGPNGQKVRFSQLTSAFKVGPVVVRMSSPTMLSFKGTAHVYLHGRHMKSLRGQSYQHAITLAYKYVTRLFKSLGPVVDYDVED